MADIKRAVSINKTSTILHPRPPASDETIHKSKCDICKKQTSKYTCPKCAARYCGLVCYKSKSHLGCSEDFYREQVMGELHGKKASKDDKNKMVDMLKRVDLEDRDKQDTASDKTGKKEETMQARMEGLNISEASFDEIWARLNEDERNLFEEVVREGDIELEEPSKPWWLCSKVLNNRTQKILEIDHADKEDSTELPEIIKDLPSFKTLLPNKDPSPFLVYNISEVVIIYVFSFRLYNGEFDDSVLDALDTVMSLSKVLQSNHTYSDLKSCLSSPIDSIKGNSLYCNTIDPIEVSLTDFCSVLKTETNNDPSKKIPASQLCISDLHNLFSEGIRIVKGLKRSSENKDKKLKFMQVQRKLYFMCAWLTENYERLSELEEDVLRLKVKLGKYWKNIQQEKGLFEEHSKILRKQSKPKLIEELV